MNTKSKFSTAICVDSSGLHLHIAVKAAHNMSVYQVSKSQKRLKQNIPCGLTGTSGL